MVITRKVRRIRVAKSFDEVKGQRVVRLYGAGAKAEEPAVEFKVPTPIGNLNVKFKVPTGQGLGHLGQIP